MKLSDLMWDNPENSARSLRVISELVRCGEMTVDIQKNTEAPKWIRVEVYDLRERV